MEGYCVACKGKRKMKNVVIHVKKGRRMAKGTCVKSGTKMNVFLKSK